MPTHVRWSLAAALCVLCAFAVIGLVAIRQLDAWRSRELARASDYAETVALLLAEHTRGSIATVDRNLRAARVDLRPLLADPATHHDDLQRMLQHYAATTEHSQYWGLFNSSGEVVADSKGRWAGEVSIDDRDYFQRHQGTAYAGLVISRPIQAASDGQLVFSMSRRIEHEDGSPYGVVVVGYDLVGLTQFVAAAGSIAGVDVELLHAEGVSVAEVQYIRTATAADDETIDVRVLVADAPLEYVVSIDRSDVLQTWYATRQVVLTGLLLCMIMSVLAASVPVHLLHHLQKRGTAVKALSHAKALIERQSAAKSNFMAAMSHEIRTPLNGVLGMARLMQQTALTEDQRHMMRTINASGEQLMAVINDVLDTARPENSTLRLSHQPITLMEVIDGVAQGHAALAREKGLAFQTQLDIPLSLRVLGDPVRLRQVISNLLSNAIKFTKHGHVRLSCAVVEEGDQVQVALHIDDSGIGIDEGKLETIFDRFTQVDSSNSRQATGSGLGLTIVKAIVERMAGTIVVESKLGSGSTFKVVLPFEKATVSSEEWRKSRRNIRDLSVLIVDDNAPGREALARTMRLWGLTVAEEERSDTALKRLLMDREHFDALLIDQRMPTLHGSDLIAALRQDHAFADTPIILMSSDPEVSELPIGSRTMLLRRPILPDVLAETLRCVVGSDAGPEDAPESSASEAFEGDTLRALVVEDNVVNRDILRRTLETLDFEVDEACDGATAIEMVADAGYDVVFMDVQMPVMDGLEATARIRELPGDAANVPIIALTANAMPGDRERYLAAGMDEYVAKPVNLGDLVAALQRQLMDEEAA